MVNITLEELLTLKSHVETQYTYF